MFPTAHGVVSQGGNVAPPEPGDGYRYYRLLISENNGGTIYVGTHTLQLRATIGGPDLPTTKGGTATASSTGHPSYPPEDAFDGDSGTGWLGNKTDLPVAWLQFDFGAGNEQVVVEYAVGEYPASTQRAGRSCRAWVLQGSHDGTAWDDLHTVAEQTGWTAGELRVFTI